MDKILDARKKTWEARVEMSVFRCKGIGTYEKLLYSILCGFADKNGCAFPTVKYLAELASCSDRQVRRALGGLESAGLVSRHPQKGPNGQIANVYMIHDFSQAHLDITQAADENQETRTVSPHPMTDSHDPMTDSPGGPDCQSGEIYKQLHITAPNNITSPEGSEITPTPSEKKRQKPPLEDWFEKFYEHYPRPVDKKKARKAFMAIFAKAPPSKHRDIMENIILRLTSYVAERKAAIAKDPEANQYTKYPASWLNAHDFTEPPRADEMLMEERWE